MIIGSSTVNMSSERTYASYLQKESISLNTRADEAVVLKISSDSKSLIEQMRENQKQREKEMEEERKENELNMFNSRQRAEGANDSLNGIKSKEEMKLEILRKMLEALRRQRGHEVKPSEQIKSNNSINFKLGSLNKGNVANATTQTNVWTKTTVSSEFFSEYENTAFQTTGMAQTTDGRTISFNVSLEMSRAFCAKYESFTKQDYILTDPLVINLGSNVASVSDQKFLFDIDSDGKEESISFLGKGSGFLALDKNGDGKINDGSELFGTKSGDGFADLSKFDEDGNGWIDEADSIFNDLRIWMKNEDGTDILLTLKEADVGAIYLGNASTQFSLNSLDDNKTNAVIQKTGIYLKESGGVGTAQHIDFAL